MSVTEEIVRLANFEIFSEGEWDKDILNPTGFHSFNNAGLEVQTGELLYGFTRILQPEHVLETGTHEGVGSCYIGLALRDNSKGHLDTLELNIRLADRARANLNALSLNRWVSSHIGDTANWDPPAESYGLILIDTEPELRFAEILKYERYLEPGGYMFIHDLHRHMSQHPNKELGFGWPFGKLPAEITKMFKENKLRPFHFGTPRGLTGFYKVHPDDYEY